MFFVRGSGLHGAALARRCATTASRSLETLRPFQAATAVDAALRPVSGPVSGPLGFTVGGERRRGPAAMCIAALHTSSGSEGGTAGGGGERVPSKTVVRHPYAALEPFLSEEQTQVRPRSLFLVHRAPALSPAQSCTLHSVHAWGQHMDHGWAGGERSAGWSQVRHHRPVGHTV